MGGGVGLYGTLSGGQVCPPCLYQKNLPLQECGEGWGPLWTQSGGLCGPRNLLHTHGCRSPALDLFARRYLAKTRGAPTNRDAGFTCFFAQVVVQSMSM